MTKVDIESIRNELSQKEKEYAAVTRNMSVEDVVRIEQSAHLPLGTDESALVAQAHSLFVRINELRAELSAHGE